MVYKIVKIKKEILSLTMDSYKETHRYAFELVKASRKMPIDLAENQPHIKEIRSCYQQEALKFRSNKSFK